MTAPPSLRTVMDPEQVALGRVYAEAFADLTLADGQAESAGEELLQLAEILCETDGAIELVSSPGLSNAHRKEIIRRVFAGRISDNLTDLLGVMARNRRLEMLPAVAAAYQHVLDQRAGRVVVLVTTALPLDDDQASDLRNQLAESLDIEPVLRNVVDETIVGGMVVQVGDRIFDASLAGQLDRMVQAVTRSLRENHRQNDTTTNTPPESSSEGNETS